MRTLPCSSWPLAAVISTGAPKGMRPISEAGTSARHSIRPWRIKRNNSAPAPTTLPTVACRAEITPASEALTWVCDKRTFCNCTKARAVCTRAWADASAAKAWLSCALLKNPCCCSARARSAWTCASCALAVASAKVPSACANSARKVSDCSTASRSPFCTRSPTLTRTSVIFKPFASAPMMASCQAASDPLADTP